MAAPRRRPRAGKLPRARLDAALRVAARELPDGQTLEWSEQELLIIDRAVAAADRGEQLRRRYDDEIQADAGSGVLVKLSAEVHGCERQVADLISKVNPSVGQAKSERHQRAVRTRWDRRDAAWNAAKDGA